MNAFSTSIDKLQEPRFVVHGEPLMGVEFLKYIIADLPAEDESHLAKGHNRRRRSSRVTKVSRTT